MIIILNHSLKNMIYNILRILLCTIHYLNLITELKNKYEERCMEFNSLTDKFHYILLTGEICNMELGLAANILNSLLEKIGTEKIKYFVFPNVDNCKQFIDSMNSKTGNAIDFNELIDHSENIKNNACMLTITMNDDGCTLNLDINTCDDEYADYDFMMKILDDMIIDNNNINLRKVLKRLLQDRDVKAFIKKYEVEDIVIDDVIDDLFIDDDSL